MLGKIKGVLKAVVRDNSWPLPVTLDVLLACSVSQEAGLVIDSALSKTLVDFNWIEGIRKSDLYLGVAELMVEPTIAVPPFEEVEEKKSDGEAEGDGDAKGEQKHDADTKQTLAVKASVECLLKVGPAFSAMARIGVGDVVSVSLGVSGFDAHVEWVGTGVTMQWDTMGCGSEFACVGFIPDIAL